MICLAKHNPEDCCDNTTCQSGSYGYQSVPICLDHLKFSLRYLLIVFDPLHVTDHFIELQFFFMDSKRIAVRMVMFIVLQ